MQITAFDDASHLPKQEKGRREGEGDHRRKKEREEWIKDALLVNFIGFSLFSLPFSPTYTAHLIQRNKLCVLSE